MTSDKPARALIFDMDGTIVDNMRFHDDAWESWHVSNRLPFDRNTFAARTAGMAGNEIISSYFPQAAVAELDAMSDAKETLYREAYLPHVAANAGFVELREQALDRYLQYLGKLANCHIRHKGPPLGPLRLAAERIRTSAYAPP